MIAPNQKRHFEQRIAKTAAAELKTALEALQRACQALDSLDPFGVETAIAEGARGVLRGLTKTVADQVDSIEWKAPEPPAPAPAPQD